MSGIRIQACLDACLLLHAAGWDTERIAMVTSISRATVERTIVDALYARKDAQITREKSAFRETGMLRGGDW